MVNSLRSILLSLKREHQTILEALDHAIDALGLEQEKDGREEAGSGYPLLPTTPKLRALLERVERAASSPNDTIFIAQVRNHYVP